ncbi:MAG: glucose 1-dehydrogenase, partial [Acidobacteria bacterium]|nr:glucose 1-dehydrogenase [Acidobacteriota bacterium]
MSKLFDERVALVTGASSGIGRATALRFAEEGAAVALLGRDRGALEETSAAVEDLGASSVMVVADLNESAQCRAAVDEAVAFKGRLDVLVNVAGIIASGDLASTTEEGWAEMMRINLDCVFVLMQAALPYLQTTAGNIVNVSSVTGLRAFPGVLAYCVSKAGLDQLTRCAALELAESGVRVNAVNPGVVVSNLHRRSGMQENAYEEFLEHSKTTHPLGRVGQPKDIAEAIIYLASSQAGWVTGVTLSLDG